MFTKQGRPLTSTQSSAASFSRQGSATPGPGWTGGPCNRSVFASLKPSLREGLLVYAPRSASDSPFGSSRKFQLPIVGLQAWELGRFSDPQSDSASSLREIGAAESRN